MNNKIIDSLKILFENSPFSQEQIANFLSVDQSTISKWKNGDRKISTTQFEKLCDLFGCLPSDILNANSDCKPVPVRANYRATNFDDAAIKSIASVNKIAANIKYMKALLNDKD